MPFSRLNIFYLTICAFGFGLAANLQSANLSTILQFSGFKSNSLGHFWLLISLTGLFQPILGVISERINTRFGQRKPLLMLSALFGVCGLAIFPFCSNAILIIAFLLLLNFGINGTMQLSRALIIDTAKEEDQVKAFSWSTVWGGIGAMLAGVFPWICVTFFGCSKQANAASSIPNYIYYAFLFGAACYLITSLITLIMVKENVSKTTDNKSSPSLKSLFLSFEKLPPLFWNLSSVLFFSWTGVFIILNYLNIFIAQNSFDMPINYTDNLELSSKYLAQANVWTSNYFFIISLSTTICALLIPYLTRLMSINLIFCLSLGIGGLSIIGLSFCTDKLINGVLMAIYGIGLGGLTTCPYIIFSKIIPKKNSSYYISILNIPVVLPQIIAGISLGWIYKSLFYKNASHIILFSGICLLISMLLSLKKQKKYQVSQEITT